MHQGFLLALMRQQIADNPQQHVDQILLLFDRRGLALGFPRKFDDHLVWLQMLFHAPIAARIYMGEGA